jgi:PAS domain S-box-containing protein
MPLKVLLVEDNPGDARLFREMLAEVPSAPFCLETAERLSAALARLADGDICAVLLDLGLPDSQGFDTFTRAYEQAPSVPILVLTGLDDEALAVRAVREGAQDYLVKGRIEGLWLVRAIRYAIERKRIEEEMRQLNRALEQRVRERTAELERANEFLRTVVAERKRAEEELSRYFTVSLDLFCIAGFDGYFKRLNPAWEKTLGFTQVELLARPYLEFVHPDDREATQAEAQKIAAGADTISFENRYLCKDGSYRWLLWKSTPITERQLIYASARDISERKQHEVSVQQINAQLEAANKELEAFTYSVSHDLRAPLRHIDGFARILREDYGPQLDSPAQHYLDRVQQGAGQMGQLIEDLLAFSRTARQSIRRQSVSLQQLVEEVQQTLDTGDRRIEWRLHLLPVAPCDPVLMKQVLLNLLANAVKFTRPRERAVIEVGAESRNGQPVLYVRDNGVGFPMKYADKLFGVFQRLHRQEDFEGTGVGLAIVQRIIHKHGGRVWAESELDRGATFYFTLDAAAAEEEEALREEKLA